MLIDRFKNFEKIVIILTEIDRDRWRSKKVCKFVPLDILFLFFYDYLIATFYVLILSDNFSLRSCNYLRTEYKILSSIIKIFEPIL